MSRKSAPSASPKARPTGARNGAKTGVAGGDLKTVTGDGKRKRANTRAALLAAARQVMAESGITGASVEKICEAAGFTRGAFYSNFEDMNKLVEQLIQAEFGSLVEYLEHSVTPKLAEFLAASEADKPGLLQEGVQTILSNLPLDRSIILLQAEIELYALRNPEIAQAVATLNETFLQAFVGLLDRALEQAGRISTVGSRDLAILLITVVRRSWMPTAAHALAGKAAGSGLSGAVENFSQSVLPGILIGLTAPRA